MFLRAGEEREKKNNIELHLRTKKKGENLRVSYRRVVYRVAQSRETWNAR